MRAGHPYAQIRTCAGELEVQIANAVTQAQWLVQDLLNGRDPTGQHESAVQVHQAASATASRLEQLVIEYGSSAAR